MNYASASNIREVIKFYNLDDKTFETDFRSHYLMILQQGAELKLEQESCHGMGVIEVKYGISVAWERIRLGLLFEFYKYKNAQKYSLS